MGTYYRTPIREDVTAELVRHLFNYDPLTGVFIWKNPPNNWVKKGDIAGSISKEKGRLFLGICNIDFQASNIAWLYFYGEWPRLEIDHRNRDKLDNSIANLRDVSTAVNCQNRGMMKTNTSGFKGVHKCYNRHHEQTGWRAQIKVNRIRYHLGVYPTPELAAGAYRIAAAALHWEA
jgi:hypothetical protein